MACGCLHNFCIDEDEEHKATSTETILAGIEPNHRSPFGWGYTPTIQKYQSIPGTSIMRDMLLCKVTQQGMQRPPGNLVRRCYEQHG